MGNCSSLWPWVLTYIQSWQVHKYSCRSFNRQDTSLISSAQISWTCAKIDKVCLWLTKPGYRNSTDISTYKVTRLIHVFHNHAFWSSRNVRKNANSLQIELKRPSMVAAIILVVCVAWRGEIELGVISRGGSGRVIRLGRVRTGEQTLKLTN